VLTDGWRSVIPFAAAMWIGEAAWLICAVLGLAAIADAFHWLFVAIKYAGVAYLLYLARHMWHAPIVVEDKNAKDRRGSTMRMFLAGLTVTLGNPKLMVFYLALLPTIIDLGSVGALGLAELTATMLAVLALADIAWIITAARARTLLRSPGAMRIANRLSATAMGGAAAAIATR
jgi:threonine/homoserine/homoserine lactone efflux protein